jgi:hypothetical protein
MPHPSVSIVATIDEQPIEVRYQKEVWRLTQGEALAFADSLRNAVQQYVQRGRSYDQDPNSKKPAAAVPAAAPNQATPPAAKPAAAKAN